MTNIENVSVGVQILNHADKSYNLYSYVAIVYLIKNPYYSSSRQ